MLIQTSDFKRCLSYFAKGVTVVTCENPFGENIGITIDSFNSVSLSPPLILFSVNKSCLSHNILINSKNFLINILGYGQIDLSRNFASRNPKKWEKVNFSLSPLTSNRIIDNCLFYLECKNYAIYPGGDHSIILGEVINASQIFEQKPLIYYRGEYHSTENL